MRLPSRSLSAKPPISGGGGPGIFFFFFWDIYVTLVRRARLIVEETAAKNEFPKIYGHRKLLERTGEEIKRYTTPTHETRTHLDVFFFFKFS